MEQLPDGRYFKTEPLTYMEEDFKGTLENQMNQTMIESNIRMIQKRKRQRTSESLDEVPTSMFQDFENQTPVQSPMPEPPATVQPPFDQQHAQEPLPQMRKSGRPPLTSQVPLSFYRSRSTRPNKFCLRDILPEELHRSSLDNRDDRRKIILEDSLQVHLNRWKYEDELTAIDLQLPEKYAVTLENDQKFVCEILNKVAKKLGNTVVATEVSLPQLKPRKGTSILLPSKLKIGIIKIPLKPDMPVKDITDLMKQFEQHQPTEYRLGNEDFQPPDQLQQKVMELMNKERKNGNIPSVYCGLTKILEGNTEVLKAQDDISPPCDHPSSIAYTSDAQIQDCYSPPISHWNLDYIQNTCGYKGEGTVVAVVDSGINEYHPCFQGSWNPKNSQIIDMATFCNSQTCKDVSGHGTMCAAVACGQSYKAYWADSDKHVTIPNGVAPKAKLIICKVLDGKKGEGNSKDLAQSLVWLKDKYTRPPGITVDVVAMSLGSQEFSKDVATAVTELVNAGVIVVCAASNEGHKYRKPISFPACLGNVICIGSHDIHGKTSPFSPVGQHIDFLAPGENILAPKANFYGEAQLYSGTSCSTPAVAGLICLILQSVKKLYKANKANGIDVLDVIHNHWMMKEILRELCTNSGMHCDDRGYGALNPKRFFADPEALVLSVLREVQPQVHAQMTAKKQKTENRA